jgi:hypothetical protein
MRIPSGSLDLYMNFQATLNGAAVTGLSGFTVARSRNGAAAVAWTTPTIVETSSSLQPGVYALLMDEGTTLDAGHDYEELVVYITKTGMDFVSRTVELVRPKITAGETLTVSSGLISNTTAIASVSGAVGSVTGAVGSVTGAVGSVTGNVGGNVVGSVASVAGAVGSVAGNVGGNVVGSVASVTAAVTLPTIPTDWITANGIAADAIGSSELAASAVTEIQSGLATAAALTVVDDFLDTEIADIQSRLPAALVSGRMDTSVGAMAANVLTATAIAADAITDAKVASDVTIASVTGAVGSVTGNVGGTVASVVGAVGSVTGNVGGNVAGSVASVTAAVTLPTIPTDWITAAGIAADAIGASELAASAVAEIQAGLTSLDAAGIRAAVGLASANLDTQLSTIDDFLDTEVAAIKAKTDLIPVDPADASDIAASFSTVNSTLAAISGYIDTEVAAIKADTAAILIDTNELQTDWVDGGRLDLILDARASQASVDTIDDFLDTEIAAIVVSTGTTIPAALTVIDDLLDTEVAAIKAKTDLIPAAPAAVGDIPTATQNADALLNRNMSAVSDTNARSPLNALRALRNKVDSAGGVLTVKKEDDSTTAWTATLTSDVGAEPIIGIDPA